MRNQVGPRVFFFQESPMFSRIYQRLGRRWLVVTSSLSLGGCALHGAERSHESTSVVSPAPVACGVATATGSYIVLTPAFALSASSEAAKNASVEPLRATASTYRWLFGDCPSQIGVVVLDTTATAPRDLVPTPPPDLPTIMIVGGGLEGPERSLATDALTQEMRIMSARAWLDELVGRWSETLDQQGIATMDQSQSFALHADALPDWLRMAALRVLADGESDGDTYDVASDHLPVRALLVFHLSPRQAELTDQLLYEEPNAKLAPEAADSIDVAELQFLQGFMRQSASALRYLRATQGDEAISKLVGATVAGMDPDWMLAHLPHPITAEQFDHDWERWASVHARSVAKRTLRMHT
jgi:hypothetical protein